MSGNTETPQNNQTKKREKAVFGLVGLSNNNSTALLDAERVVAEPYSKLEGINSITVNGVNNKGEDGNENAITALGLELTLADAGRIIKNTMSFSIIQTAVFPSPAVGEENVRFLMVFDTRIPEKAQKVFKITRDLKENIDTKTEIIHENKVVLATKKVAKEDFEVLVQLLKMAHKELSMNAGYGRELKEKGLASMTTAEDYSTFVRVFDNYFDTSDENIKILNAKRMELEEKNPDANMPKIALFKTKGALGNAYNLITLNGIEVNTLSDAQSYRKVFAGEANEGEVEALKEQVAFLSKNGKFYVQVRDASKTIVGFDSTGNIIILENDKLNTTSNSQVYPPDTGNLSVAFKDINDAKKVIKSKFFEKYSDTSKKIPSDDEVINAERIIRAKASKATELLFTGQDKKMKFILGLMGKEKALDIINQENDVSLGRRAYNDIQALHSYTVKAIHKNFADNNNRAIDDFLVSDKSRMRGKTFGGYAKPSAQVYREIKDSGKLGDKEKYSTYTLVAMLPTFSVYENKIINYKMLATGIADVHIGENSGVVGVTPLKSVYRSWSATKARFGAILNAIAYSDEKEDKYAEKMTELINYGATRENGKTNFGLCGIKKTDSIVKQMFSVLISDIYTKVKDKDYEGARDTILNLRKSDDRNLANLGRYCEAVKREFDKNQLLNHLYFSALSTKGNEAILSILNGAELPKNLSAEEVRGAKVSSSLINKLLTEHKMKEQEMLEKYPVNDGKSSALEDSARSIGFAVRGTSELKLSYSFKEGQNTKVRFDNSINTLPFGAKLNPFSKWVYEQKNTIIDIPVVESIFMPTTTVDITDELAEIEKEFQANKPKNNSNSRNEAKAKALAGGSIEMQQTDVSFDGFNEKEEAVSNTPTNTIDTPIIDNEMPNIQDFSINNDEEEYEQTTDNGEYVGGALQEEENEVGGIENVSTEVYSAVEEANISDDAINSEKEVKPRKTKVKLTY